MNSLRRTVATWKLRSRTLELGRRTLVMGVINITSDSFSDGGHFLDPESAIARCLQCLEEGADILDLGAESTRPGSQAGDPAKAAVSAEEELARLLPVIEGLLKAAPHAVLSVDTYKAQTARTALAAGAEIINDVSGFTWDQSMPAACARSGCGVVLMHTRGRPEQWRAQNKLPPDALLECVHTGLADSLKAAAEAGVATPCIVLDPGYGFGKKLEENYALLASQSQLLKLGRPLLAGFSRKSFLIHTLSALHCGKQAPMEARETASTAALVAGILHGASIVRVHQVRSAVEAARIADAIVAST